MTVWNAITSCGDSAVLLPLMAWMALCLLLLPADRLLGLRWIAAVGITGGAVALSKLLFMGWGIGADLPLNYTGFSGHTALSMLTWPALAALLARHGSRPLRLAALAIGFLLGVLVAISRLIVKAHSPCEVVLGAALALLVGGWFHWRLRPVAGGAAGLPAATKDGRLPLLLTAGLVTIMLTCYGRVFPSQHVLKDLAMWLSGRSEVFSRRIGLS